MKFQKTMILKMGFCLLGGGAMVFAQEAPVAAPAAVDMGAPLGPAPVPAGAAGAYVANVNAAIAAINQGNFDQAEAALGRNAVAAAGTAKRELETAQALASLAFCLHDTRNYATAAQTARRALTHIDATRPIWSGSDNRTLSLASEWEGLLEEKILDDSAAAEACYQQSVSLDPTNVSAAQGLRHLKAVDQLLAQRPSIK
jgi:tetratricopeptide (TPR) repeat protein